MSKRRLRAKRFQFDANSSHFTRRGSPLIPFRNKHNTRDSRFPNSLKTHTLSRCVCVLQTRITSDQEEAVI